MGAEKKKKARNYVLEKIELDSKAAKEEVFVEKAVKAERSRLSELRTKAIAEVSSEEEQQESEAKAERSERAETEAKDSAELLSEQFSKERFEREKRDSETSLIPVRKVWWGNTQRLEQQM